MLMPSIFRENLVDDFFNDFNRNSVMYSVPTNSLMKTDVRETENDYELLIDLPGYNKEDVQAELRDGYLVVNAKKEETKDDTETKGYIRRERFYGSCSRSFFVGKDVKEEDITASFKDGVLTMTVPKHVEKPAEEKKYIAIA